MSLFPESTVLVLVVDSVERFKFFQRLRQVFPRSADILIVTSEPLVYLISTVRGWNTKLVTLMGQNSLLHSPDVTVSAKSSIEYLNGDFDLNMCERYIASFVQKFSRVDQIDKIVVWNGQQVVGRAVSLYAAKNKVDVIYLELSNLPNKIFSDGLGVNANSSLYSDQTIIDRLEDVGEKKHALWCDYYFEQKKKVLPQANKSFSDVGLSALNALFKNMYASVLSHSMANLKAKKSNVVNSGEVFDQVKPGSYVFLPLQVSTDTQIKLHSDFDNVAAIKYSMTYASANSLNLVVKVHPAEKSQAELDEVYRIKEELAFQISNDNTNELIAGSESVITINSTVGLEAMIMKKPVKTLGRAFYSEFDQVRLRKYIHSFLVDGADYFSDDTLSIDVAKKVLKL